MLHDDLINQVVMWLRSLKVGTNWETYMAKVGLKVDPGGWLGILEEEKCQEAQS